MLRCLFLTNEEAQHLHAVCSFSGGGATERRSKPRIEGPFFVIVRGDAGGGEFFESHSVIDNISAGGLYLRLKQPVGLGMTLFFTTSFSTADGCDAFVPRLALHGTVLRTERTANGACGVAVALSHHRFL
jgi:hypothetical protein